MKIEKKSKKHGGHSGRARRNKPETFIERACGADEKIILLARLHWIAVFAGMMWAAAFVVLAALAKYLALRYPVFGPATHVIAGRAGFVLVGMGFAMFLVHYTKYRTTRVGLTTRRILLRTGLLFVDVQEVDLEELKGGRVNHGMLGRFLDYGEIYFDSRFVGDFYVPCIARPYALLRAAHEASAALGDTVMVMGAPVKPRAPRTQSA